MKVYFVSDTRNNRYVGTLAEAREIAKQMARFDVLIDQVEIGTDLANILRLANCDGGTQVVLRRWELTPRGALNEISVEK